MGTANCGCALMPQAECSALQGKGSSDHRGMWFFSSTQHWWHTPGVLGTVLSSPSEERHAVGVQIESQNWWDCKKCLRSSSLSIN